MRILNHKLGPWLATIALLLTNAFIVLAQEGWAPSRIGLAGKDLNTVYFLDNKRGWVAGDDGFLSRTDDAGLRGDNNPWARKTPLTTSTFAARRTASCWPAMLFSLPTTAAIAGAKRAFPARRI